MIANALSIAGSDPSGGAGVQADLKAFAANGVYGMCAITALTAQNTQGVSGVHLTPPSFVADQIAAVLADIRVDAVKIGMIATADIAVAVADALADYEGPIVLDPVMVAKGGSSLLAADAAAALAERLALMATIMTPNLPEAAALLGVDVATTPTEMAEQGAALLALGPRAVLLKGGHLSADDSPDVLISAEGAEWLPARRIATANTHGTGCTLSSSIAAGLAKGMALQGAVATAKTYVAGAIAGADDLSVGTGHGPTHHFHALWR
jgi:hydroxymethylpyrimidine/phosphomethylpyrimidine kinase